MGTVDDILAIARAQLGKPYVFGAAGPNNFDCSGLVMYAYNKAAGISLPHHAADQAKMGTAVSKDQIAPGDLVFSDWGSGPNSHVGIAVSPTQIIDAPHTGALVRYDTLSTSYRQHITAVRRFVGSDSTGSNIRYTGPSSSTGDTTVSNPSFPLPIPGADQAAQALKDIAGAITGAESIAEKAFGLFAPSNFTRVIAAFAGVVFIIFGIWFLSREIRD